LVCEMTQVRMQGLLLNPAYDRNAAINMIAN